MEKKGRKTMKKTLSIVAAIMLTFAAGNSVLQDTLYASADSNSRVTSEYDNPWDRDSSGRYDDSSSRLTSENDNPWDRVSSGSYDDSGSRLTSENDVPSDMISSYYEDPSSSWAPYSMGSVTYDDETNTLTLTGAITKEMVWKYRNRADCTIKHIVADETCLMPEDCSYMFLNAESKGAADYMYFSDLETIDISKADTTRVTNMEGMFYRGGMNIYSQAKVTEINVSGINTSYVTNMKKMFGSTDVTSIDVSSFDTSNVTNMEDMFSGCDSLTSLDLASFDTSKVTRMGGMFAHCENLTELDLSSFDTSSLETGNVGSDPSIDYGTQAMFYGCSSLKTIYVSDTWNSENVPSQDMFGFSDVSDSKLNALAGGNGTKWSQEHIDGEYARIDKEGQPGYFTYKKYIRGYTEANNETGVLTLHGSITKKIIQNGLNRNITSIVAADDCVFPSNCHDMFRKAYNQRRYNGECWDWIEYSNIDTIDLSKADTSKVTDMSGMFRIGGLAVWPYQDYTTINVSGIDTSNVINMSCMFEGSHVTELDVSSFDTSKVKYTYGMFCAYPLKTIYASEKFDMSNVEKSDLMFGSYIVGGNGTQYDENKRGGEYARIDKEGQPGYFTYKEYSGKPAGASGLGDVNGDKTIDIEDAVLVIGNVNGNNVLTSEQEKSADVDGSGNVDIEDAVAIISHVNGVKSID